MTLYLEELIKVHPRIPRVIHSFIITHQDISFVHETEKTQHYLCPLNIMKILSQSFYLIDLCS